MIRKTVTLSTLAFAAACATPNPPTVSAGDVSRAYAEAAAISNLPFTQSGDLPSGRTTYNGKLGADVSGDATGSILGDMRMTVDFGTSAIGGDITNINLINSDGRPNQRFDGKLDITGNQNSGRLDGFASGDLQAVDAGLFVDTNVLLILDGDVLDDVGKGDAVFGSAKGDGIGDWNLDIDGVFFGTSD